MPTLFFFLFLVWLSFLLLLTEYTVVSSPRRRILHQPLFPLDTLPPTEPPLPPSNPNPNPKYPFSTSPPSPPTDAPFFPAVAAPPPPPSPATFASFPANISSLILPHTPSAKHGSSKLVALSIAAVVSALAVLAVAVFFFYYRRRARSDFSDDKTYRSENSSRFFPAIGSNAERAGSSARAQKLRTGSSASSEFLYLGTLVDSRRIEEGANSSRSELLEARKMESPELHPLPPLVRQSLGLNGGNNNGSNGTEVNSTADEEEEEFYSPRGSLGTGSGSRRVFAAAAAGESFRGRTSSGSSSCSCASSSSASPDRSQSISYSPPASLSPKRSESNKSLESSDFQSPPPPPPLPPQPRNATPSACSSLSSPERDAEENSALVPPRMTSDVSDQVPNARSPSLSPISSPERAMSPANGRSPSLSPVASFPERALEISPRIQSDVPGQVQNARSPSLSPISSSPERALNAVSRLSSSHSSASSSPERLAEMKNLDILPSRKSRSPSLASSSCSPKESPVRVSNASAKKWLILSPERDLENNSDDTSSISNDSVGLSFDFDPHRRSLSPSSSPERVTEKNPDSSPRVSVALESDRRRHSPSPSLSSSLSSPERALSEDKVMSPRALNASDQKSQLLSPERDSAKIKDESPRNSNASEGILFELDPKNPSLSSSPTSSSPERDCHNNSDASPRTSINSEQSAESPARTSTIPPPPPPPPLPLSLRQWEASPPALATPTGPPISNPPALVPPSRPFVLQSPTNVSISPVELPPPSSNSPETADDAPKPKLKPLHWDKVRASSDREMVWDQLRSSSFKLNEEMIETLFVVKTPNSKPKETTPRSVLPSPNTENRVIDPKKSQNIAISLRALNVTIEEVCEALLEGNADALGNELLESLLKMAPTKEEERKLKEYKDDSPVKLGPAEKFLKAVLDVPYAFKRVDAMLYAANFESEVDYLKKSFETLESACEELRNSRMFFKLLEAVLKTGNRMNVGTNRGDAHAFKLDTLLKLVDVKGADGKTTLLHFVVQEIIRTEGARFSGSNDTPSSTLYDDAKCRKLGLQVVSGLSSELTNVKKAAAMDSDILSSDVSKLSRGISNIREVVRLNETTGSDESNRKFSESMDKFMKLADEEIIRIQAQESVALSLVKEITEYFHGNSAKEEAHPFRIFLVVRDFLAILDRVCKEVGMINERTMVSSAHKFPVPVNPLLAQVLPVPPGTRPFGSQDDECSSP